MVWVYDRTRSLLVAMLMHASLTASTVFIFVPLDIVGVPSLTWAFVLAAVLWITVAAVALAGGGEPVPARAMASRSRPYHPGHTSATGRAA
jgi:hypothetical protein